MTTKTTTKAANYTAEQTASMVQQYTAVPTAETVAALAEALGDLGPRLKGLVGERVEHLGRIRVLRQASRRLDDATFRAVTSAVLERRRLSFSYRARSTGEGTVRTVSRPCSPKRRRSAASSPSARTAASLRFASITLCECVEGAIAAMRASSG